MIAILHNIRSLHNVGSIFRTADAAGVEKLYLCGITPTPLNRFDEPEQKLTKVSLGAEQTVPWEKASSTVRLITKLKKEGFHIIALEQDKKSVSLFSHPSSLNPIPLNKLALIVGNEVDGISPVILKKCDTIIDIPMRGIKESLNVSVAFGVAVFYLTNEYA